MQHHSLDTVEVLITVANLSCFHQAFDIHFRRDLEERRPCRRVPNLLNSPSRLSYTSMIRVMVMQRQKRTDNSMTAKCGTF